MKQDWRTFAASCGRPARSVRLVAPLRIEGHIYDLLDLDARWIVELRLDDRPVSLARADLFDLELMRQGIGDGCYRFAFALDEASVAAARVATVALANHEEILGEILLETMPPIWERSAGEARWIGGLKFEGWVGVRIGGS